MSECSKIITINTIMQNLNLSFSNNVTSNHCTYACVYKEIKKQDSFIVSNSPRHNVIILQCTYTAYRFTNHVLSTSCLKLHLIHVPLIDFSVENIMWCSDYE